jgi:tripartite ATP-independent transporter DctP family solute receptor
VHHLNRRSFIGGSAAASAALLGTRGTARAATFEYKHGHHLTIDNPVHVRAVQMWAAVKRDTGGQLDVTVFPNQVLGTAPAMMQQLRAGGIQFMTGSGGTFSAINPVLAIDSTGFAFKSSDQFYAAQNGKLGTLLRAELAKLNIIAFRGMWEAGFRQVTTTAKPIRTPEDLAGLKIRTAIGPMWIDLFRSLGVAPTPIGGPELYTSLQTHVVDGQESEYAFIELLHLAEVEKYVAVTNHMFTAFYLAANGDALKALPENIQQIVAKHAETAAGLVRADAAALNLAVPDKLRRRGMLFTAVDQAAARRQLTAYYSRWQKEFGPTAWSILESYSGPLA